MKREYPESPLVGVGAVIVADGRALLIRRGQAPLLGEWSLPGGVLECGETLRGAVIREAREETGLIVEVGEMLGVYERVIRSDDGRVRYHYVLIDFLCRRVGRGLESCERRCGGRMVQPRGIAGAETGTRCERRRAKGLGKMRGQRSRMRGQRLEVRLPEVKT